MLNPTICYVCNHATQKTIKAIDKVIALGRGRPALVKSFPEFTDRQMRTHLEHVKEGKARARRPVPAIKEEALQEALSAPVSPSERVMAPGTRIEGSKVLLGAPKGWERAELEMDEFGGGTIKTGPLDRPIRSDADILAIWDIDPEVYEVVHPTKVKAWDGMAKVDVVAHDTDGKAYITQELVSQRQYGCQARFQPKGLEAEGALRYTAVQAEPITVIATPSREQRIETDLSWSVILPDYQIPFQDHAAVDVAMQITADVEAIHGLNKIVNLGDDADLPELSSHVSAGDAMVGLNRTWRELHAKYALQRAIAPDAEIDYILGNHEQRIVSFLIHNARALMGMYVEGEETGPPVLSVEFLAGLSRLGVNVHGPYPEGQVRLNRHLHFEHGRFVAGQPGGTSAKYLQTTLDSTGFGHIHRKELVYRTFQDPNGGPPKVRVAGSPGTLCRIDGRVPSSVTNPDHDDKAGMTATENWQQGLWIVGYETSGSERFAIEPVHIQNGWAQWRGKTYIARCDVDGNPLIEESHATSTP